MKRLGRSRNPNKPPRMLLGVHPIPTLVTLGNLLSGFGAIILAMRAAHPPGNLTPNDCLHYSALLIFLAMIFDVMDGKVARWTRSTSKFGMEMDSLSDVISFGLAPAVLVKAMIDTRLGAADYPLLDRYIFPMLATYVACAALRLARYNVESESGHRDYFFGMPSPGAAGSAVGLALLLIPSQHPVPLPELQSHMTRLDEWRMQLQGPGLVAMPFIMLGLGILMVSRVKYPHMGDRLLRGRKSFMHLMVLVMALILVVLHHEIMLMLAFNGYVLFGLLNALRTKLLPKSASEPAVIASSSGGGSNAALPMVEKTSGAESSEEHGQETR